MKILVTEHVAQEGLDYIRKNNIEIEERLNLTPQELAQIIGNYDAIITRSGTRITKETIANPGKLKVIGRAGVGVDSIDIAEASKKGIIIINAPGANTIAAAELTTGMMLNALRKLPTAHYSLKYERKWDRKKFMGVELSGKTLGIVGLGHVGSEVAKRAKAFGAKCLAYDPYIKKSKALDLGVELVEQFDEILERSDIITFHTPLTKETKNMMTKKEIDKAKDGVILINCARGGIINEKDLYDSIKSGKVAACGIDTFEKEPAIDNPLLDLDNVFVTPHIGANSNESQINVSLILAQQIVNALLGKPYQNAINIPFIKDKMSKEHKLYFDLAEKMGNLAAQLTEGRPSQIDIIMIGSRFEEDVVEKAFDVPFNYQPFTIAALKGFLEFNMSDSVSYMNAPYVAKELDIIVSEAKAKNYENYNNLLLMKISTDKQTKTIGATLFEDGTQKIVLVDEFRTDIAPKGIYLYIINKDRPGTIGKIGTILGNLNINIAGFHLSRQKSGFAMSFIELDTQPSQEAINLLKKIEDIELVKTIVFN